MELEQRLRLEEEWSGRWFDTLPGLPGRGWFLVNITPTPFVEQRITVTSDIMNNRSINVTQGRLYHSTYCTCSSHHLPKKIHNVIHEIPEVTYKVAVFSGDSNVLNGQPVAIVLDPIINRDVFPDHPHLNFSSRCLIDGKVYVLPESLCYIEDPEDLGKDSINKMEEALIQISMWLYRHQVWLATREQKLDWIGPGNLSGLNSVSYALTVNPFSPCRCGGKDIYMNCHLLSDIQAAKKTPFKMNVEYIRRNPFQWNELIGKPQKYIIVKLTLAWKNSGLT